MEIITPLYKQGYACNGPRSGILSVKYGNYHPIQDAAVPSSCVIYSDTKKAQSTTSVDLLLSPIPKIEQDSRTGQTHALLGMVGRECGECPVANTCELYQAYSHNSLPLQYDQPLYEGIYYTPATAMIQGFLLRATFPDSKRMARCEAPEGCLISKWRPVPIDLVYQINQEVFKTQTVTSQESIIGAVADCCDSCPQQNDCTIYQNYQVYTEGVTFNPIYKVIKPIISTSNNNHRSNRPEGSGHGRAHKPDIAAQHRAPKNEWLERFKRFFNRRKR
jgi:hypothetical protein